MHKKRAEIPEAVAAAGANAWAWEEFIESI